MTEKLSERNNRDDNNNNKIIIIIMPRNTNRKNCASDYNPHVTVTNVPSIPAWLDPLVYEQILIQYRLL